MDEAILRRGLERLGMNTDNNIIGKFAKYSSMLTERNKVMNLTAITDDAGISTKHFLDSILPLSAIDLPQGASVIDVGTGAGFPGIPMKIMRPDISLTLLDSLLKRVNFLEEVCGELKLESAVCIHARAEDEAKKRRERYDAAVSRAVAPMNILAEYCLPYVKVGGVFLALKTNDADKELAAAKPMIGMLGGKVEKAAKIPLPETDIIRSVIVIRKISETPKQFPRRAAKIKSSAQKTTSGGKTQ